MKISLSILCIFFSLFLEAAIPQTRTGGFFSIANSGREVYNFNPGWHFHKGAVTNGESVTLDDSNWELVNCPHGLELTDTHVSGSRNYQGEAWYRKHFHIPSDIADKKLSLYFEAIMGKSKVWLNGQLIGEQKGGFLPFSVELNKFLLKDKKNILAVWTDNSDDASFPPGKPQNLLDFTYFGGIYRDIWLISTNSIYITDPNAVDKVAGGGIFVHYENLSKEEATVVVATHIKNESIENQHLAVNYLLKDKKGLVVASETQTLRIKKEDEAEQIQKLKLRNPNLWSPKHPYLYDLEIRITKDGQVVDGQKQRIGIRKIEFRGKEGFYLNNKPYEGKLIGANRHQDHAYVGNALPNSGQWRDAKLLKEAACDIVRAAHYPADPAFMDACDELGIFFIVATPGWQFWNKENPEFEQAVYDDVRNMVRRDRNHPSVIMWEPILNETWYPEHFAKKVHQIIHEEYPWQGVYTACDEHAKGQEYFDVIYSHPLEKFHAEPLNGKENYGAKTLDYSKRNRAIFTREWGDCVDNWDAHNSPSRVAREWGEKAQLIQLHHYANPPYRYSSWEVLHDTPPQHVGGTLWHSFDHQRGYHPDPFYGGIADVFRQPKYAYYLFKSQRDAEDAEPFVRILHEMTPFSGSDLTVVTNCEEVRLTTYKKDTILKKANEKNLNMPHPVVTFNDVFDFLDVKVMSRNKETASFLAEGLINGKVVATHQIQPALRPTKIKLELQETSHPLIADGSDFVTAIAYVTDAQGQVKRLNNEHILFEVTGEASIIDNGKIQANPKKVSWGTAPILIRSTTTPGSITIKARSFSEGLYSLEPATLTFKSEKPRLPLLFSEKDQTKQVTEKLDIPQQEDSAIIQQLQKKILNLEKELSKTKLKEVEQQQSEFEGN